MTCSRVDEWHFGVGLGLLRGSVQDMWTALSRLFVEGKTWEPLQGLTVPSPLVNLES